MKQISFNADWVVSEKCGTFGMQENVQSKTVTLPYDVLISTKPTPDASGGYKTGFFRSGTWEYKKTFSVPAEYAHKKVIFQFDGVYRRAMVYINGDYAGGRSSGYSQFFIDARRFLKYGAENVITVVVHTADDERWYSGAGIYRDVYMLTADLVHIVPHGLKIITPDITEERAVAKTTVCVKNESAAAKTTVQVEMEVLDGDQNIVACSDKAPLTVYQGETGTLHQRLYINKPLLWDVETPDLYTCHTRVISEEGTLLDESVESFGIRSLSLDTGNGLSINGKTVKLQGACIHHDNGPIGAASLYSAEARRVALLKEAGFNAVRMAHNPASPTLLKACDRLGMLVMDEAFDQWTLNKSDFDYANDFTQCWEEDLTAMVDKDYNHPSVILYSIGNEISDTGTPNGAVTGRRLAERLRGLDTTRFITNGINGMVSVMDLLTSLYGNSQEQAEQGKQKDAEINAMMSSFGDTMKQIMTLEVVTEATAESFACLDVAGYNYMDRRYETDRELFPNRIICGTETFSPDIDQNWRKVRDNTHVIGDFCWTGWDYLGEAGIGHVRYDPSHVAAGVYGTYPALTAMTGDISITGYRRPSSYYKQIVFGLRKEPFIAVQRPQHYNDTPITTPWCWSDSVSSWSWQGYEGKPVKVEIYSDADEVELLVNGTSTGRQPAGESHRFKTVFDTTYLPGEIVAIAYDNGKERNRFSLRSASGDMQLMVLPERNQFSGNSSELVYLPIALTDENGTLFMNHDRKVWVTVEGAGELMGFGTDDPKATESFADAGRTTFDGRALAVIRPTRKGEIKVTVCCDGLQERVATLQVKYICSQ